MRCRHPLPKLWLLTDERLGDGLWDALRMLPRGSGVVVRQYSLSEPERRRLLTRIRAIGRARGLTILLAGHPDLAQAWGADGHYGPLGSHRRLLHLAPVHDLAEIRAAERAGADMLILSPLFPTRSHPGAATLGPLRFATLARATRLPVLALGGVDKRHAPLLKRIGAYGWGGIDAFQRRNQKRNAVPT